MAELKHKTARKKDEAARDRSCRLVVAFLLLCFARPSPEWDDEGFWWLGGWGGSGSGRGMEEELP